MQQPGMQQWAERYTHAHMNAYGTPRRLLTRGRGAHVWDADDTCYIDLLAGIAVNSLGHAHPALTSAVSEQFETLGHISNFFASRPQIALAEELLELYGHDGRVFFANSGSEANETALKITRRTGRSTIVVTDDGFHGRTMGALALTSKPAYREPFAPHIGEIVRVPYNDTAALERAVDDTVAAVLVETMQGEAGVVVGDDAYLHAARRIADDAGALLWIDEVQTGMGRTGHWFDHHHAGVTPDIMTLAKGLAGGFPIGACIAAEPYASYLQPGSHGATFGGNPMASACGLAVINTIRSDGLLEHAVEAGNVIAGELSAHRHVADITGRALLRGIVLDQPVAAQIESRALESGVVVNAPAPNRLRIAPPLVIDTDTARRAAGILGSILDDVPGGE